MNYEAIWIPCGITIAITLIAWIFTAGQTAGRIKDQEKTLLRHDNQLGEHEDRLNDHSVKIAKTEAWHEGYSAAKGNSR